jgi:hypothetical protein
VTISEFFEYLGAPLANVRWSWGATRKDGSVILRVWTDQVETIDGVPSVCVLRPDWKVDGPNPGLNERLRHLMDLRRGGTAYLVFCESTNPGVVTPRKIKSFDGKHVVIAGRLIEEKEKFWLELGPKIPANTLTGSGG